MLRQIYRLTSARQFESNIVAQEVKANQVVVRPMMMSICHADQRYYGFNRNPEILKKKIPMALVHEGMGKVIQSRSTQFHVGDSVVMVPTLPQEKDKQIGENYLPSSKFMSSSTDGMMQEYVICDEDRLVKTVSTIPDRVAAFVEMMSVANQGIHRLMRVANTNRQIIGIWGDGNLSYILAVFLKVQFPQIKVYIFGHHQYKLDYFSFVDRTFLTSSIPKNISIDHAIEATGGEGVRDALRQILDYIKPEGAIALMGVSENEVPIYTRTVLEKGLTLIGSSRSTAKDFKMVVDLLKNNKSMIKQFEILVDQVIEIHSLADAVKAFEADRSHAFGKTIMKWNI